MADSNGLRYRMLIMQWGPIPPSGGPTRERYLDHHGRIALQTAASEYDEALRILGADATAMPVLDFALVEANGNVRRTIQRAKRTEWLQFHATIAPDTLHAVEPHIKQSVSSAMDALNYLEDHPLREEAHAAIHRGAFVKRGLFGCPITHDEDGDYWTDCPIDLSHLRMGISAGLVSDFECSICRKLVEDCDHEMGAQYPMLVDSRFDGRCTACNEPSCDHTIGETVMVTALATARNISANEVSMVARPRYPLARMVAKSFDLGSATEDPRVQDAARKGALNCDGDLGPCKGFNEMTDWDLTSASALASDEDVDQPIDML